MINNLVKRQKGHKMKVNKVKITSITFDTEEEIEMLRAVFQIVGKTSLRNRIEILSGDETTAKKAGDFWNLLKCLHNFYLSWN